MRSKKIRNYFASEILNQKGIYLTDLDSAAAKLRCVNFSHGDLVYYHIYSELNPFLYSGTKNLLGYTDKKLTTEQLFDMMHPDDAPIVFNGIRKLFSMVPYHTIKQEESYCKFTYRIRHKKGHYLNILRESRPFMISEGLLGGHFSSLTNISYLNVINRVNAWGYSGNEFYSLLENIQDLFTCREKQVLTLLAYGKTSCEIACLLGSQKATVDKHRQNMLAKTSLENTMQLVMFGIEQGFIKLPLECNSIDID